MPYRDRETGEYPLERADLAARHPNTSLPAEWGMDVLDFLNVDPVFESPMPEAGRSIIEADPELVEGKWFRRWESRPTQGDEE